MFLNNSNGVIEGERMAETTNERVIYRYGSVPHSTSILEPRVWCLAWRHDGRILATCGDNKFIRTWAFHANDNDKEAEVTELNTISGDHSRTVRYVEFSRSGGFLACASFDSTITIYKQTDSDLDEVYKLEGHQNEVKCCTFSASDEFLASCGRDKTVWIWQMNDDDYEVRCILQNHTADVKFVAWHPSEDIFVSGGYDSSLLFYKFDYEDFVVDQYVSNAHDDTIWSGAFSASGEYLATCGADYFVNIWKHNLGEHVDESWSFVAEYKFNETRWPLYSVAWNPEHSNFIALGGADYFLRILRFDPENKALSVFAQLRLDAEINCVRWNPRFSNIVAAACDDGLAHFIRVDLP